MSTDEGGAGERSPSRRTLLVAAGVAASAAAIGIELEFGPSASAAGSYLRPCGDVRITSSWADHKARPSPEPGTDYQAAVGTPVRAAADGVIVDTYNGVAAATGRYVALRPGDNNYLRYLHLSSLAVVVGQRVSRGDVIAYSGGSGRGGELGYDPHIHVSMWLGQTPQQAGITNTVDFELYVGGGTAPIPFANSVIKRNNNTMTSFFYKVDAQGNLYALAGDGQGEAAWLEFRDKTFASSLAVQHGSVVRLSDADWPIWKAKYLGTP